MADADNSVALGANSYADRANTVSVGDVGDERQITNVAAGSEDTDAVNLAQLQVVAKTADNTDHFFKASEDPDNPGAGAYVEGINATGAGENAHAIGDGTSADGGGAYALGDGDRESGVWGKRGAVRVARGGRGINK